MFTSTQPHFVLLEKACMKYILSKAQLPKYTIQCNWVPGKQANLVDLVFLFELLAEILGRGRRLVRAAGNLHVALTPPAAHRPR